MTTEKIWADFKEELLGFVRSKVGDPDFAEDILQEIFIKIHLNYAALKNEAGVAGWVYRITRNAIIDFYRKKKRMVYQGDLEIDLPEEFRNENGDFTKCLKSFIGQLKPLDRDIIEQTVYGNLSQKEYAANYNLSYSTAKSRLQRAKEKLKKSFVDCCAIEADKYGNIISSEEKDCNC